MTPLNSILQQDLDAFTLPAQLCDKLRGTTIAITGATGLIGSTLLRCLNTLGLGIKFILPVRNAEKAHTMFAADADTVTIIQTTVRQYFDTTADRIDYIIHCASPTDGKYMCAHPAETYLLPILSTQAILEYCRRNTIKGAVYISSMEYYGQIHHNHPVTEQDTGYTDPKAARSSYGLGKQAAEYLAWCYATQYRIPIMSARLTQTFGAGISPDDNRVFAQFAKSVIQGTDIVLHTQGKSAKPYCYTTDCAAAITYILLKGTPGEAYNVATPGTYVTIRQLAELCRDKFNPSLQIRIQPLQNSGYAPETTVNLDTTKIRKLGWQPKHDLTQMMARLINYLKECNPKN